jgi:HlyD family secretion protein
MRVVNMKRRVLIVVGILCIAGLVALIIWLLNRPSQSSDELTLYGNVDLRQVDLAFNNNERIVAVRVQEGDHVRAGQVLARLDESRLVPQMQQVQAQRDAQAAVVERMHNGSRPQEIAQAQANMDSAAADARNARQQFDRLQAVFASSKGGGVSKQDLDNATAALDVAQAKLQMNQKALDLLVLGPRKEDINQAEAQLRGDEAQLAFVQRQLADAVLVAPLNGVIRSRLMEPGDMASPQKPIFTLAILDPKWVRVYVSEPDLGKVHPGMPAYVTADSFPDRRFEGWVGFVSSVAEFTPKPVQTEELRTKLVYEVRVFVNDPSDDLRLGMPATAHLALNAPEPTTLPTTTTPIAATAPAATQPVFAP